MKYIRPAAIVLLVPSKGWGRQMASLGSTPQTSAASAFSFFPLSFFFLRRAHLRAFFFPFSLSLSLLFLLLPCFSEPSVVVFWFDSLLDVEIGGSAVTNAEISVFIMGI